MALRRPHTDPPTHVEVGRRVMEAVSISQAKAQTSSKENGAMRQSLKKAPISCQSPPPRNSLAAPLRARFHLRAVFCQRAGVR